MESVSRFFNPPKGSFFLFGPRGTGKTTWLKGHFRQALFLNLLDPDTFREFSARPERLRERLEGRPATRHVVIDEVQRVPEILSVVHQLIDEKGPSLTFALTGSSARKLRRTGVDLMAGRAVLRTLHPFMAGELGTSFHLGKFLKMGMIPLVLSAKDPEETLRSYVSLYIKEEVQAEGLVRNIGDFSRFLEVVSLSHGSLLNVASVSRECQVGRKTVEGYLGILEDLLLSFRIGAFTRKAQRLLTAHPKFYLMDSGVYRILRPRGPLDTDPRVEGHALEGLVAQHLRAWAAYGGQGLSLHYWRTFAGLEVDFVVYGEGTFDAFEVKSSKRVHGSDLKALKAFREDYPEARVALLHMGKDALKIDGIPCLPIEEFLREIKPGKRLPI